MIRRAVVVAFVIDLVCVLIFVIVGRAAHHEKLDAIGIVTTLWPYLASLVVAWFLSRSWRQPRRIFWNGVAIWVITVLVGAILRAVSGQDAQIAFVGVSALILGVLFLGWRAIAHLVLRGSRKSAT